jgi:hypothetical protein
VGLSPLEFNGAPIPTYYDPGSRCEMEVLRFDTRRSSPRYHSFIDSLTLQLATVPVVTARAQNALLADMLAEEAA